MVTVIFGRPSCPYCVRAKELTDKLSSERDDFIAISMEGIIKADLEKKRGQTCEHRSADFY